MIIKVNSRNQITLPKSLYKTLNIKVGDKLLLDIQDGIMILIPQPKSYITHLQSLHSTIWKDVEIEKYIDNERDAW